MRRLRSEPYGWTSGGPDCYNLNVFGRLCEFRAAKVDRNSEAGAQLSARSEHNAEFWSVEEVLKVIVSSARLMAYV